MDRGGARKRLLEPLLDKGLRFIIRSTGERTVVDRHGRLRRVAEVAMGCPLRYQACAVKIDKGQEKSYELRYSGLLRRDLPWTADEAATSLKSCSSSHSDSLSFRPSAFMRRPAEFAVFSPVTCSTRRRNRLRTRTETV